jgi:hypothetical protein
LRRFRLTIPWLLMTGTKDEASIGNATLASRLAVFPALPAIEELSTAFWDACLRGDEAAQKWLDGKGPRSILEPADKWQTK